MITLNHYLLLSGILFAIGLTGVLMRRNLLILLMSLELMLSAVNISLIAFSRFGLLNGQPDTQGQILVFFSMTVAAAEVAIGLAIIIALYRAKKNTHIEDLNFLKG